MSTSRFLTVSILIGIYLNMVGWAGNALVLGDAWDEAYALITISLTPPYPALVKELLSLASDFVYAFVLVWIFAKAAPAQASPTRFAFVLILVLWTGTVGVTYHALVNSGFLPFGIAWKTSLWALATFLPLGFVLPRTIAKSE